MDRRHPGAGIIPGIVAGEGIDDIRTERYLHRCPPASDGYCIIEALRERDIGWKRKVYDRDTGILAERYA
jgi:hypothetical protein